MTLIIPFLAAIYLLYWVNNVQARLTMQLIPILFNKSLSFQESLKILLKYLKKHLTQLPRKLSHIILEDPSQVTSLLKNVSPSIDKSLTSCMSIRLP